MLVLDINNGLNFQWGRATTENFDGDYQFTLPITPKSFYAVYTTNTMTYNANAASNTGAAKAAGATGHFTGTTFTVGTQREQTMTVWFAITN